MNESPKWVVRGLWALLSLNVVNVVVLLTACSSMVTCPAGKQEVPCQYVNEYWGRSMDEDQHYTRDEFCEGFNADREGERFLIGVTMCMDGE